MWPFAADLLFLKDSTVQSKRIIHSVYATAPCATINNSPQYCRSRINRTTYSQSALLLSLLSTVGNGIHWNNLHPLCSYFEYRMRNSSFRQPRLVRVTVVRAWEISCLNTCPVHFPVYLPDHYHKRRQNVDEVFRYNKKKT